MKPITIRYIFTAQNFSESFDLQLDSRKIELIAKLPDALPEWANLDFHQCPHCPLRIQTHPYCPLIAHTAGIVKGFEHVLSYDEIHLKVITEERTISQDTTVQRAISSLLGVISATSGCPHTGFFKPMARFHLPLSSEEETIFRVTSMYMLAQYFLKKEDKPVDFHLNDLERLYRNIHIVNDSIAKRLREAGKTDSVINSVVLLDLYTKNLPYVIGDSLEEIRHLFEPFLNDSPP
jgi:hypothetical protein